MKKFFISIKNKITNKANELAIRAMYAIDNIRAKLASSNSRAKLALHNNRAEGYVDSGVKILIAVVIGALLLSGLYKLFNTTIMPTVTKKITDLFNYKG